MENKDILTPMLKQYLSLKEKHRDKILLFRLGDFYETFFEDAKITSRLLGIVLTSRPASKGKRIPMAGIPYHALDSYLSKFLKKGYKVAICEQVEDPKLTKGLVKREVVRIITPGTVLEENILEEKSNNYLVSLLPGEQVWGMAWVDVSTGEAWVWEEEKEKIYSQVERLSPSEIILPESHSSLKFNSLSISYYPDWGYSLSQAKEIILRHFQVTHLDGLGLTPFPLSTGAAGALLAYLEDLEGEIPGSLREIKVFQDSEYLLLDAYTVRNLELLKNVQGEEGKETLLGILDETRTPMGARLLRRWILHPLKSPESIQERLKAIQELIEKSLKLNSLREVLNRIYDLERIMSRLERGVARGKDLVSLRETLGNLPALKKEMEEFSAPLLVRIRQRINPLESLRDLLDRSIVDNPPFTLKEGGLIKDGFSRELDELKKITRGGKEWIARLQQEEIEKTGIKSLKVRYNKVFGYYIEITKSNLHLVPSHYIRKQTLVNAERFITPELKEKESTILHAEERIKEMEYEIFLKIREETLQYLKDIQETASAVSELDVLSSLSSVANKYNYTRPEVNEGEGIIIEEGRHPVLERILEEPFVPNDTTMDGDSRILIITGPNMAGKSTYIRQVALILIMAQMGSYVPAKKAVVGVADRVFTRIGAADELTRARSTFMVEMNEVANILRNATAKSLIILDEVGRGTSTFDGISIAWAVAEFIHEKIGARTLFATHYHEITELEENFPKVKNLHIAVKEWGGKVIFMRKIMSGATDKSYGIHVAQLAGLPREVIRRAGEVLEEMEKRHPQVRKKKKREVSNQLTFFTPRSHPIIQELKNLDLNTLTPLKAFDTLRELVEKVRGEQDGKTLDYRP
ncbi:MAG: DNA mismatch repair protein MutS [Caldiserica bacterium]|nr:DNA mismatch repair protein MutS [Caldisericota bacterium]